MAITVSEEFKALWEQKQGKPDYQRIGYKRRYKAGGSYFNESDWKYLERDEWASIGKIPQQADVRRNVIKHSVVTLKFPNENNQWIEHAASPSFYAADGGSWNGYKSVRTLWRVEEGMKLSDGTIEWIAVFTGIQMKKPRITGGGGFALVEVASKGILLEKSDAEEVRDTDVTLENCIPATGDGTNTEFESTSTGVDHATDFQVNGASRTQGSGWRVSNENEIASAGNTGRLKIDADPAPGNTHTVKISLRKWLKNNLIETLLGLLADEAGITSAERSIAPAVFPGEGVSGSVQLDSSAEWVAGDTIDGTEVTSTPGSVLPKWLLVDDFADGDFTTNPTWAGRVDGNTAGWSVSSGKLTASTPTRELYTTALTKASGTWQVKMDRTSGNARFAFMGGFLGGFFFIQPHRFHYWIEIDGSTLYLYRGNDAVDEVSSPTDTLLASVAYTAGAGDLYRITRSSAGVMNVYVNGVLKLTATDTQHSSATSIMCYGTGAATFDDIYYSNVVEASVAVTEPLVYIEKWDLLSAPVGWGAFEKTEVSAPGWTIAYATDVSTDDFATSDGYTAISGSTIGSLLKRYLRLKITFTQTTPGVSSFPSVEFAKINFNTDTVFVSLANHRGKTVARAMEGYIKIPDYELRFRGDGTLVIGPKTAGTHVVHLTQENGIVDITEVDYGVPDRVVRFGRVRYQGFTSFYGDAEAGASAETIADGDEIGKAGVDEDLDDFLVANDLQLGDARARVLYENNRRSATDPYPPVRMRAQIWDVPWLEVGDVVRMDFYDHPLLSMLQANDELLRADSPYFHMGDPGNVITKAKDWRVLYYNPDKDSGKAEILVEEVL